MLQLKNITKNYVAGDTEVRALKGVSIEFRESEFVSILGPSGCGKTTMLNIIGGLDRYTDGDLIIGGRSTKEFRDKDWDSYRNHKIGFVFQNYNLIPHQTVLSNVELALTLSGVSKSERRLRAAEALEKVGLGDQLHKKPNQMSGGQMQRVAIARALVNDPDIILADEPTGALDSETSVQIMDILKDISDEKLIIMVTHNGDLAEKYSSRIIRLLDGKITGDSDPFDSSSERAPAADKSVKRGKKAGGKVSMSFFTALSLSFKNLLTKKGRTFLTSFAGSIGIIGIALILSLSNGFQSYIDRVQEDTISTYPITIEDEMMDLTSLMETMLGKIENETEHEPGKIYTNSILGEMINSMMSEVKTNSLGELKAYFESDECNIHDFTTDIQYGYDVDLNIYSADTSNGIMKVNPSTLFDDILGVSGESGYSAMMSTYSNSDMWIQMIDNQELLDSQYDVLAGRWPQNYNEVVLVTNDKTITDVTLYALGLKDASELDNIILQLGSGNKIESEETSYTYDELLNLTFKLVLSSDYYEYDGDSKRWNDRSSNDDYVKELISDGTEIKIVGIIEPKEDAVATSITGSIGYTKALTEYVIDCTSKAEIVKEQLENEDTDVFTGLPFADNSEEIEKITIDDVYAYIATLPEEQQQAMQLYLKMMTEEQIVEMFKSQLQTASASTLKGNLTKLGFADTDTPASINIYAKDFNAKDEITAIIENYNQKVADEGHDSLTITYTDYIGLMMSSISTIINTISYVLIAFVSISLVVSSIMIGIITYISVLERTKEIGILRSIGASKHDVSRVFNAETMIIGLVSGSLGILITVLLDIPINIIIKSLTKIPNVAALPWQGALILIAISVMLTLIAGLIPAKVASRKDPVIALRTE
ncbi:MAG: ATP-binding cassette domain-containing protein [Butyrivibrio sp.]|nr:ATP-binding cassette domain-containing protein [Butyrivibrio sp.]